MEKLLSICAAFVKEIENSNSYFLSSRNIHLQRIADQKMEMRKGGR